MSRLFKQIKVVEEKLVCIRILLDPSVFSAHDDVLEFFSLLQMRGNLYSFIYDSENLFTDFIYSCDGER